MTCPTFHQWGSQRNGVRFREAEDEEAFGERLLQRLEHGEGDAQSYKPVLRTSDGTIHKLSALDAAYFYADGLLEQIRHATGLPRLDWPAGSAKRHADRP